MIHIINKFIEKEQLFEANSKILLAVSGGIDSMCLLDILYKLHYNIGVAHLNHKLRQAESDEDEQFVKQQCKNYKIDCYTTQVDVKSIADTEKKNISEVGRTERYKFFTELIKKHNYTHIATAHHADDDVETFIMRSMDGSGLVGLAGIPIKNNNIVRPLLQTSRIDIEEYVKNERLQFREDSSNQSTKYVRNAIRKEVIPALVNIKSSSQKGIKQSIDIIKDSSQLLTNLVHKEIEKRSNTKNEQHIISLLDLPSAGMMTFIFHAIRPFGFNRSHAIDISEMNESGKYFYSDTHTILYDRDSLIISETEQGALDDFTFIIPGIGHFDVGESASFQIEETDEANYNANSWEEKIDGEKIRYPLKIRRWQSGDSFKPFGMKGQSQSLQDFFTNQKLSRIEKQNIWLLTSNHEIIWVIGYRVSESVKVESTTNNLLKMTFTQQ